MPVTLVFSGVDACFCCAAADEKDGGDGCCCLFQFAYRSFSCKIFVVLLILLLLLLLVLVVPGAAGVALNVRRLLVGHSVYPVTLNYRRHSSRDYYIWIIMPLFTYSNWDTQILVVPERVLFYIW
jgi:hypothetical protein